MSNKQFIYLMEKYLITNSDYILKKIEKKYKKNIFYKTNFVRGFYYTYIRNNFELGEIYYKLAIDDNDEYVKYAANILGDMYYVKKEYNMAEKYYEISENYGYPDAINNLGCIYKMRKEYKNAEIYFNMAIIKGSISALNNMGLLYEYIKKDCKKAEEYYKLAAEKNYTTAIYNLGHLYVKVKKDYVKAKEYHKLAADRGDLSSQFELGYIYYYNDNDYKNAEKYLKMVAKYDDDDIKIIIAINILGDMCFINKNYIKAEEYYNIGAKKNDSQCIYNLAYLYFYIKQDYEKTEKYARLSISIDNHNEALHLLGHLYTIIKKDYINAEIYYLLAVNNHNNNAQESLIQFYDYIKDYNKAYNYSINFNRTFYIEEYEKIYVKFYKKENNEKICMICDVNKSEICCKTCNNNEFCFNCIYKWSIINDKSCPLCRN